jgi:putative NADH-flavin reductase
MKLLIIGATGRTGRILTREAVSRGHVVAALVRPTSLLAPSSHLNVVVGDPLDAAQLGELLTGQDAVISTLGQNRKGDSHLLRNAAAAMLRAYERIGSGRYLVVSQGLLFPTANPLILILRALLRKQVADSIAMEGLLQRSDLDWTIVRPPRLTQNGKSRGFRISLDGRPAVYATSRFGRLPSGGS